jgi:outer membrane protein OmpA-like peptidoglycan-associated protein
VHIRKILTSAILSAALLFGFSPYVNAQGVEDDFEFDESEWINNVPATSYWGLRGLTQTVSAEPLGAGRFSIAVSGSYFKQDQAGFTAPNKGAHVTTFRGALAWGLNDQIDLFGLVPFYVVSDGDRQTFSNIGGIVGGLQYSFAIPEEIPFRLALQAMISSGMRTGTFEERDITTNYNYWRDGGTTDSWNGDPKDNTNYAGFDFWDARKRDQIDLVGRLSQTVILYNNNRNALKLHFNQGIVATLKTSEQLLLLAGGLQFDATQFLTLGFEANLRTRMGSPSFSDPFWVTPSIMYRSPYHANGLLGMNLVFGMDIRTSQGKDGVIYYEDNDGNLATAPTSNMKPLEPWRLFGDIVFSFDRFASRRMEIERQARRDAAEKARLRNEAQMSQAQRDSIARQAREDSLRLVESAAQRAHADSIRAQFVADSLAALMDEQALRARQDSLALAEQARQQAEAAAAREAALLADAERQRATDSLALAEAQKRLEEERSRRSEAEQSMLTTGMLVLDAVHFATGRADIHINSRPYLTTIARMLIKYPKLRIEIGGHTDNTGSLETNMRLSQQRSDAVFAFMVSIEPALAQMLTARGYGPTMPKADNNTAAGRELNRRVELKVLNPEVLQEYNP